jgi:hypothetical protein
MFHGLPGGNMTDIVKTHSYIGLASGIEREVSDLLHMLCAQSHIHIDVNLNTARIRFRHLNKMAVHLQELIEEEIYRANEIREAKKGHVRGSERQIDFRDFEESWERVRQ